MLKSYSESDTVKAKFMKVAKPVLIIVDDDVDFSDFVKFAADEVGFEVYKYQHAVDFQNALEEIKPDLIITDIVMPDIDGIELLMWLSEQSCLAQVILMSGYDGKYLESSRYLGEAKGVNIIDTLSKPINFDDLLSMLNKALDIVLNPSKTVSNILL